MPYPTTVSAYDSVLAAFRAMNSTYRPDTSDTVVLFTDGKNNDPVGTTLENLLASLAREFDPVHPVHINIISYGDLVDSGVLARIAKATRGDVYPASSPQQAQELFLTTMYPHA